MFHVFCMLRCFQRLFVSFSGHLGKAWGACWRFGSHFGCSVGSFGELLGSLGRSWRGPWWPLDVSWGSLERAKGVFGRHFGTPWVALSPPGGEKAYAKACGQRFGLHLSTLLFVTVHASWAGRGLRAHQTLIRMCVNIETVFVALALRCVYRVSTRKMLVDTVMRSCGIRI